MARLRGAKDEITHYIFDTVTMLIAGTAKAVFFGHSLNDGAHITNLKVPNRFPSPESFEAKTLQISVPPGTSLADLKEIYTTGYVTLFVGKTTYIDGWCLDLIPLAYGIGAVGTAAVNDFLGSPAGLSARVLNKSIPIDTDEPFRLEVAYGTAPTPVADVELKFIIGGTLIRQVQ
jgi:hypothetical protein